MHNKAAGVLEELHVNKIKLHNFTDVEHLEFFQFKLCCDKVMWSNMDQDGSGPMRVQNNHFQLVLFTDVFSL